MPLLNELKDKRALFYGYIYKTTNLITGKIYVGKKTFEKNRNRTYFGSGTLLLQALKKYGKENFAVEILDFAVDKAHLNLLEKWWIQYLDSRNPNVGYNIVAGGQGAGNGGALKGRKQKRYVIEAMRKSNLGRAPWNKGLTKELDARVARIYTRRSKKNVPST